MTQAQYLQAAELLVRDPDFVNFPAIPHGLPPGGDVPPTFRAAGRLCSTQEKRPSSVREHFRTDVKKAPFRNGREPF